MAIAQRGVAAVVAEDDVTARRPARHDRELMLTYYREMLLIRRFEEKAGQLYGMGLIGGFCHLYIGQEAVAVGVQHALKDGDSVITAYRDHGHMLATGMDPRRVMAELTGRVTGYSKGKGGSMHMFARDRRFYGGHGIVGACVPLGTGIAFAHKYREDGGVCVTYLGDGAVNQGQVYESFNMAALWKLPVVYVIENNKYGMGTSVERASASTELHRRGEAYGIQGRAIDGMDVLAVREAAAEAVASRPRPGTDHRRGDDLPLSWPLDVGSGQIPLAPGSPGGPHRARSDRPSAQDHAGWRPGGRGQPQDHRQGDPGDRQRGGELRPGQPGARSGRAL